MLELLQPSGTVDGALRILFAALFFIWNLFEGSFFESPYPKVLVELYSYPLWRIAIVLLVFFAAIWCPRVGILLALAVFFYMEDLEVLVRPWSLS
jgi:hypothetical protein